MEAGVGACPPARQAAGRRRAGSGTQGAPVCRVLPSRRGGPGPGPEPALTCLDARSGLRRSWKPFPQLPPNPVFALAVLPSQTRPSPHSLHPGPEPWAKDPALLQLRLRLRLGPAPQPGNFLIRPVGVVKGGRERQRQAKPKGPLLEPTLAPGGRLQSPEALRSCPHPLGLAGSISGRKAGAQAWHTLPTL